MTAPVRDHAELLELARRALVSVAIEERRQSIEFAPLRMPVGHQQAAALLSTRASVTTSQATDLVLEASKSAFDLFATVPLTATPAEEAAVALARDDRPVDDIAARLQKDHAMSPESARELAGRVNSFRPAVAQELRLMRASHPVAAAPDNRPAPEPPIVKPTVQERAREIQAAAKKDGKRMTFADAMIEASLQLRARARTRGRR
jgi:hypothetical protein